MIDFEQLYRTYFDDVYRYILRLSRDEHVAEDVTADTFFRALRSIDSFRGECDVRVWLCQIAKHRYYSYLKKHHRTEIADMETLQQIPDSTPTAAEECAKQDEVRRIQTILHSVCEPYKEVFLWRVYAQLSFKEIGQIFGKTENWACVTYHRAKAMIQQRLEEESREN